jgi:poly-gamma-glutamate capsule biosynthesis protein CapA/YwtB (metallophosphatase superfamily)
MKEYGRREGRSDKGEKAEEDLTTNFSQSEASSDVADTVSILARMASRFLPRANEAMPRVKCRDGILKNCSATLSSSRGNIVAYHEHASSRGAFWSLPRSLALEWMGATL